MLRLHLQPLAAPSANQIRALRMFGDDPLQSLFFDSIEKQDSLFPYVIAEFYFRGRRENFFQKFFSPEQWQVRQIMSLEVQEIKDIVEQMTFAGFRVILEHLEIRMSLVINCNNFPVQNSLESKGAQRSP